jgi:hypothetical protein
MTASGKNLSFFDECTGFKTYHAKPTPQASFSKPGSYNPLLFN